MIFHEEKKCHTKNLKKSFNKTFRIQFVLKNYNQVNRFKLFNVFNIMIYVKCEKI
jgi:hypothetical protein